MLGVYVDIPFVRLGTGVAAEVPFVLFLGELSRHVRRLVVFGRLASDLDGPLIALEGGDVEFVALPHYIRLTDLLAVGKSFGESHCIFADSLWQLDAVWIFGPHPLALLFARRARRAGVPVILGVRQDFPRYLRRRLPGPAWLPLLGAAYVLEWEFRRLARTSAAVVAGEVLGRNYRRSPRLINHGFSLVATEDLVVPAVADRAVPDEPILLSVGRLDPEKNPVLLADVLAGVLRRWPRARMRVLGAGPMADQLSQRARDLAVHDHLCLAGQVPFGPRLRDEYRDASVLVHVSWTEGLPQVLFEAMAAGLPIVATDVGGVGQALHAGALGVLIPPGDAESAARAIDSLLRDPVRRSAMARAALASVAGDTMTARAIEIAALVDELASSPRRAGPNRGH